VQCLQSDIRDRFASPQGFRAGNRNKTQLLSWVGGQADNQSVGVGTALVQLQLIS
jgi:hypothetical protein